MAYVPYRERAVIDPAKIRWFLTNKHREDFARFGIAEDDANWLETALLYMVHTAEYVGEPVDNQHGIMYALYEAVTTPTGKPLPLLSGWIVRRGEQFPRLVTAYPRTRAYRRKTI